MWSEQIKKNIITCQKHFKTLTSVCVCFPQRWELIFSDDRWERHDRHIIWRQQHTHCNTHTLSSVISRPVFLLPSCYCELSAANHRDPLCDSAANQPRRQKPAATNRRTEGDEERGRRGWREERESIKERESQCSSKKTKLLKEHNKIWEHVRIQHLVLWSSDLVRSSSQSKLIWTSAHSCT